MKRGIVFTLLLSVLLGSGWSVRSISAGQSCQRAAEQWQGPGDRRFCQVSVYWQAGEADAERAAAIVAELEKSAREEDGAVRIAAAFGGAAAGQAAYDRRRTDVELWHVSEAFFCLHTASVLEGGIGRFRGGAQTAVLNEEAAWRLFGSVHGVGESILIEEKGYRVIAVLREPRDAVNRTAYESTARIYLPMEDGCQIDFLEAVLPEYYTGFAAQSLTAAAGTAAVTNTGRFRLTALWEAASNFFASPPTAAAQLPPWERAARLATRRLCALWPVLLASGGAAGFLLGKSMLRAGRRRVRKAAANGSDAQRIVLETVKKQDHPKGPEGKNA